mmetsp:Transcript_14843/g.44835  ORF Transcript_14843/g.44835 Transcript_14843/m.44835 type:complete len:618 (-) Transcript_14843:511-2364(-)
MAAPQKRSALSAALASPQTDQNASPPKPALKDSDASFPCLNKERDPASIDEVTDGVEALDVHSLKVGSLLAGSAPQHFPAGSSYVDYELNPHRRRGGQERFPASVDERGLSAGTSLQGNLLSDAVLGSLPAGLSHVQRNEILSNSIMSPTQSAMSSLPSEKLMGRNLEGKKLRRHVLRDTVIVFVTAGYSGKKFIYEKAHELGVRSVILDGPDSWAQSLLDTKQIEKFVPIDFTDAESAFDRCVTALKKVKSELGELDGICTYCEMAVPLVARLAERFGLPGNTPESVDAARDKHSTRSYMAKAGLPTPRNMLIERPDQVEAAGNHVGFPAVIKPIYGAASIGVVRVNDMEALKSTYTKVAKEMAGARIVDGAMQAGAADEEETDQGNAGSWVKLTLLLEEYLDGPEVDVDLVLSEGSVVYGAITDNWPTIEPYFNETGSNCPSILPREQQAGLMELGVQSVNALGLSCGVFHVELKYTSRGPRLIEVNCRMGGGPVRLTNLLVWGVDLVEEHLLCSCGIPSRPPVAARPLQFLAEYSLNASKSGTIQHTDYLKEWEAHPDVLYAHPLVEAGKKVTGGGDGMPTWVCEFMVTKPTVEEAIEFVTHIEHSLQGTIPIV